MKRTICWNRAFEAVNACTARYRVLMGSAGSGKSVNAAQDFIRKLSDKRYAGANLLVVRRSEETHRYSTYAELRAAIGRLFGDASDRVWKATVEPMELHCLATGCRVIFRGMNDVTQREKLKSVTFPVGKLTWIWIEEATELREADADILDDRLRGALENPNLYYQLTYTFNPVSASHWLKAKFFDIEHPEVFTHRSTYRDNRFIDAGFHARMEMRRMRDPEGYRVYGLGEWGETGGLILANYRVHPFPVDPGGFDSMVNAQDFGFNHADAILEVGFKDDEVYVCREIYERGMDTGELIALAQRRGFRKHLRMWCDCAEPDRIKTWRAAGFAARGVVKERGSVGAQIDYLKQRTIHIHPSCEHTIGEIAQWKWKCDPRSGLYLDEPVDCQDDAMAALRYAVEEARRGRVFSW